MGGPRKIGYPPETIKKPQNGYVGQQRGARCRSLPDRTFLRRTIDRLPARHIRSVRFYERRGFEFVGVLRELIIPGHDEILLRKTRGTWTAFREKSA